MRAALLCCLTVLLPAFLCHAECRGESTTARQHLVELYTSEGCSSCPPAEKWMSTLGKHPDLIGLEFHIDSWDDAHWRDPFSDHAFTLRQQALSRRGNHDSVFTPQIWLDGQVWQNWPRGAPPAVFATSTQSLRVNVDGEKTLSVHLDTDTAQSNSDYRLYAALTVSGLTERVLGGENRGKQLSHDNVVRAFAGPAPGPHADLELKTPADFQTARSAVVAFIQNESDGSILQAVRIPLLCR